MTIRLLTFALLLAGCNQAQANVVNFVAMGDTPYYLPEANSMFEKLIDQVNAEKPDFSVHVGDIRGGDSSCLTSLYLDVYNLFARFEMPLVYTPGDNEWTDCWKTKKSRLDPLERLRMIRFLFFSNNMSLGAKPLRFDEVQGRQKLFAEFVENRRWQMGEALFATVHIVGSDNNYHAADANSVKNMEFYRRTMANLAWLQKTFAEARAKRSKAVVLFFQADMLYEKKPEERQGFNQMIDEIRILAASFNGQILIVQGDSHSLAVDQPISIMTEWKIERPLENLVRLQVFGAPDVRAVKVRVDTSRAQPFTFEALPQIPWEYPKP